MNMPAKNLTLATQVPTLRLAEYESPGRNPAAVYLDSLAKGSRRAMGDALVTIAAMVTGQVKSELGADERKRLVSTFPWHQLRYEYVQKIRAALMEAYAPATVNKMLAALRGTLRQAWQLGYIDADDYQRAAAVKTIKGETLPAGRTLTSHEIVRLFAVCENDRTTAGTRDAAILAVMYGCGLRRAELVALEIADYESMELKVRGKGRKERLQPITETVAQAVGAWLELRGDEPGALFCPVKKSGQVTLRAMTDQAVYGILGKRAKGAGISSLSPHDLRRSFVTHLLESGADVLSVQKLAGHASTQTTLRYDRRDEKAKRKAVERLSVPYSAPGPNQLSESRKGKTL